MKKIAPTSVMHFLLILSANAFIQLMTVWNFGDETNIWTWLCTGIAFCLLAIALALNIITAKNKKLGKGDEYSTKIVHKAAYDCLIFTMAMIVALIFIVTFILVFNRNPQNSVADLIDVRVILSAVSGILVLNTFLFALLVYIYNKKGEI